MTMRFRDPVMIDDGSPRRVYRAEVPEPIRAVKIPRWLRRRVMTVEGLDRDEADQRVWGQAFVDHAGTVGREGREVFVSEPYPMGLETLRQVVAFGDRYDLDVRIGASSAHYPTVCLRVEFSMRGEPTDGG